MKHDTVMTRIYENEGLSLLTRLGIAFHVLGCSRCSHEIIRYEDARELMRTDFFEYINDRDTAGVAESIADAVMRRIGVDQAAAHGFELPAAAATLRDWVITGVIMIMALVTSFFGTDFGPLVRWFGDDFVIPLAVVIGLVITAYIAVFIGRHLQELKELTEKFGLRHQI